MAVLSISALTLGFISYHFITQSPSIRAFFEKKWGAEKTLVYWIYFQRLTGVFFYGIIPAALILGQGLDFQQFGWKFQNVSTSLFWIAGLSAAVVLLNFFAARTPDNLATYPQIRASKWSRGVLLGSALTWAAYLLAYEFLFRGYLLFSCLQSMGKPLAITLNVAFYALVHVPKGWKETVGAVPLGIVLCLLTLQTGTIWIAFFVHLAMAWSNEWWSLFYQVRATPSPT
ncbi:MAG: CPBP family intramembrane glutamic endopeptidase [Bacteroidota bacterium]